VPSQSTAWSGDLHTVAHIWQVEIADAQKVKTVP
jgi:hypothetical protein